MKERARRFGLNVSKKSPSIFDEAMELDLEDEVGREKRRSRGKRFDTGDISWMARSCFFFGVGA